VIVEGPFTPDKIAALKNVPTDDRANAFEEDIVCPEAWAKQVLERAGLPSHPDFGAIYTIPDGEVFPRPEFLKGVRSDFRTVKPHLPREVQAHIEFEIPPGTEVEKILNRSSSGRAGSFMALVEARGFRQRMHREWYAAEILRLIFTTRCFFNIVGSEALCYGPTIFEAEERSDEESIRRADIKLNKEVGRLASDAFELGGLIREADIRFNVVGRQVANAGRRPKNIPAVAAFVKSRLLRNPSMTAAALWRLIPRNEFDGIKIKGEKLSINGDLLRVTKNQNAEWIVTNEITYPTFRNYVTAARKDLLR
jgi:hypothetical protein